MSARILTVLAAAALGAVLPCTRAAGQFHAYVDESENARVLLSRAEKELAAGQYARAVSLIAEVLKVAPDSLHPDTGQGVRLAVCQMVYRLPVEARELYEAALADRAEEALLAAWREPAGTGCRRVMDGFPGTRAARRAAEWLWVASFEQGNLAQTVEQVHAYLADPLVKADKRRLALFALGVAAAKTGQRESTKWALQQLKAANMPGKLKVFGQLIDPVAHLEKLAGQAERAVISWNSLGGDFSRRAPATAEPQFSADLVFSEGQFHTGTSADAQTVPARQQLLQRRVARSRLSMEPVALVTRESFVVARGSDLVALDRATGRLRWRLALLPEGADKVPAAWPSAGDGCVAAVVAEFDERGRRAGSLALHGIRRRLVVLSEETGKALWSWPADHEGRAGPRVPGRDLLEGLALIGSPLVHGGRVFVGAARRPRQDFRAPAAI